MARVFCAGYRRDSTFRQRLRILDWDFADATTNYLTHVLHPYPAKFIPQIPNALIQELSSVEDTVLDIFCGSGTTLVESLLLKRNAVGIDANPLACLVSRAKTTTFSRSEMDSLSALSVRAQELAASLTIPIPNLLFQHASPKLCTLVQGFSCYTGILSSNS